MIITIVNSRKAQALQILDSAKRKYLEIGKQISYKIMNENPLDNVSNIEILPDDIANQLIPRLAKFKSDVFSNGDTNMKQPDTKAEANLRQAIQEILTKTYFKK
jgi:hypothetical protein